MLTILYFSCAYISDESFTSRLDPDNDGYLVDVDCDNQNPLIHTATTWYLDEDGDGFAGEVSVESCTQPSDNYYLVSTDCNDSSSSTSPIASEMCDGVDNNCNGRIDDAIGENINGNTYYFDLDNDGFGVFTESIQACFPQPGYVENYGDCNDYEPTIYPLSEELPGDGVDQDCNGIELCFVDEDGDGFGGLLTIESDILCSHASTNSNDCDDNSLYTFPGAAYLESELECMKDVDRDGYGDNQTDGDVNSGNDCDDFDPTISPNAMEIGGDGVDQDCDGSDVCFLDTDGDGFGGATTTGELGCFSEGLTTIGGDCDDSSTGEFTFPGAAYLDSTTSCMSDNDQDGYGAEFPLSAASSGTDCNDFDNSKTSYDGDLDGYSTCQNDCDDNNSSLTPLDGDSDGYSTCQNDCDDGDSYTYPGAAYLDSSTSCMKDADQDGHGAISSSSNIISGTDCDDSTASISPSIPNEAPNDGIDQDCDGFEVCYIDADLDGFGTSDLVNSTEFSCVGVGISTNSLDCNDNNPSEYPNQSWYSDLDGDGFGAGIATISCVAPQDMVVTNTDCNDELSFTNPAATEICDLIDNNCDGGIDGGIHVPTPGSSLDGTSYANGTINYPSNVFLTTLSDVWDWRVDGFSLATFQLNSLYSNADCGYSDFTTYDNEIEISNVSHSVGQGSLFTIDTSATTIGDINTSTYIKVGSTTLISGDFTVQTTITPELRTEAELEVDNLSSEKMALFSQGNTRILLKNLGYDTGQVGLVVRTCLGEALDSCSFGTFSGLNTPEQKHTYTITRNSAGIVTIYQDTLQLQGSFSMPSVQPSNLVIGTDFDQTETMVFQGAMESLYVFPFSIKSAVNSILYSEQISKLPLGMLRPNSTISAVLYDLDASGSSISYPLEIESDIVCASSTDCDNDGFSTSMDCDDENPNIHAEIDLPSSYNASLDATDNIYTSFYIEESIFSSSGLDVDVFEINYTEFQYVFQTQSRENLTNKDAFACSIYTKLDDLEVYVEGPEGYETYFTVTSSSPQTFIVDEITDVNQDGVYTVTIEGQASTCSSTYEISCYEYY